MAVPALPALHGICTSLCSRCARRRRRRAMREKSRLFPSSPTAAGVVPYNARHFPLPCGSAGCVPDTARHSLHPCRSRVAGLGGVLQRSIASIRRAGGHGWTPRACAQQDCVAQCPSRCFILGSRSIGVLCPVRQRQAAARRMLSYCHGGLKGLPVSRGRVPVGRMLGRVQLAKQSFQSISWRHFAKIEKCMRTSFSLLLGNRGFADHGVM